MANTLKDMINDAIHEELDEFLSDVERRLGGSIDIPSIDDITEAVCPVVKEFIDNQLQLD